MKPRDMAKFGHLYLNNGKWNGNQVISEEWTEASFQNHYSFQNRNWIGYGYLWWLRSDMVNTSPVNSYYAFGWGGQRSIVFPELNMVVVFTGGNYIGEEPVEEMVVDLFFLMRFALHGISN